MQSVLPMASFMGDFAPVSPYDRPHPEAPSERELAP